MIKVELFLGGCFSVKNTKHHVGLYTVGISELCESLFSAQYSQKQGWKIEVNNYLKNLTLQKEKLLSFQIFSFKREND